MRTEPGDRDSDCAPGQIHNWPPALVRIERDGAFDHRGKVVCPIAGFGISGFRCQGELQVNYLSVSFEADRHDVPFPSVIDGFEHVVFGLDGAAIDAFYKITWSEAG